MDEIVIGRQKWVVVCTQPLQLQSILKERDTHGKVYIVSLPNSLAASAFVSQSIPPLVEAMRQRLQLRLYPSTLYRILRGVGKGLKVKWKPAQFSRDDIEAINAQLINRPSLFFITKDPEKWIIRELIDS